MENPSNDSIYDHFPDVGQMIKVAKIACKTSNHNICDHLKFAIED